MRRVDWKVIVLLGIIVSVLIGFLYGTGILGGDAPKPGSQDDPLMSSSAAQQTIDTRVASLEAEITALTAKISTLEKDLTELYAIVNQTGSAVSYPPAGGTGQTGGSTVRPAVSAANVGKTGTVTGEVVNLREAATTSSKRLRKLTPRDRFTITKVDHDWYQVQLTDGTVGWVAGYLVKAD